jgi:hypothetical protein
MLAAMIRNIVGSWLLAAFLVVVAVGTWRLLDAGRSSCTRGSCPHAVAIADPPAHTCGAGSAPLEAPPPIDIDVEPAHTCGAGGEQLQAHDPFEPPTPTSVRMLNDDEAQLVFQDAVEHLRMRDNPSGCLLLHRIMTSTASANRWHLKSQNLFAHRCAP